MSSAFLVLPVENDQTILDSDTKELSVFNISQYLCELCAFSESLWLRF